MRRKDTLESEFHFILPRGLIDTQNRVHRQGVMRLATAKDEIWTQKEPKVQENSAYAVLVMLSRVITRLGSLSSVSPNLLEGLTVIDLAYLREFYNRMNQQGNVHVPAQCPHCNNNFTVELQLAPGVIRYPSDKLYEEVAFVAYHFHWTQDDILNLDHPTRQRWVGEISKINKKVS